MVKNDAHTSLQNRESLLGTGFMSSFWHLESAARGDERGVNPIFWKFVKTWSKNFAIMKRFKSLNRNFCQYHCSKNQWNLHVLTNIFSHSIEIIKQGAIELKINLISGSKFCVGRDSSVGIATHFGLDGPGIESRWGGSEIFRTRPYRHWGPPSPLYNGYRVFPGGKAAGAWRWPSTLIQRQG